MLTFPFSNYVLLSNEASVNDLHRLMDETVDALLLQETQSTAVDFEEDTI